MLKITDVMEFQDKQYQSQKLYTNLRTSKNQLQ